ncbi:MAG: hypothetical protein ACT4OE_03505 [Sphingosinicella sp.]
MKRLVVAAAASALLLAACEARFGNDAAPVAANASAAGKAQQGRMTIEAPGFSLKVAIPEGLRAQASFGEGDGMMYPGATFGGIHVQGRPARDGRDGGGEVELRFDTSDAPDRVLAWYRDPARREHLTVRSARRQGQGYVLAGTGEDDGQFTLTLSPRAGGGTDARLVLTDSGH